MDQAWNLTIRPLKIIPKEYIYAILGERTDCNYSKVAKKVGVFTVLHRLQATYISMLGSSAQRTAAWPEIVTTPWEWVEGFSFTKWRVVHSQGLAFNSKRILWVAFFTHVSRLEISITSSVVDLFCRRSVRKHRPELSSRAGDMPPPNIFFQFLWSTQTFYVKKMISNRSNWEGCKARQASKKAKRTIVNDRQALRPA